MKHSRENNKGACPVKNCIPPTAMQALKQAAVALAAAFVGTAAAAPPAKETAVDPAAAQMVILVRHAEKAAEPGNDPPLGAAGIARAEALAAALRDARVTAIITTQFRRTRDTARPLADSLKITPQVVAAGGAAAHVEAVVAAVRQHRDGAVLVVGHGNTVPAIIAALGGPRLPDLCESAYANLFTLVSDASGTRLVRSRYGPAEPEPGPDCK